MGATSLTFIVNNEIALQKTSKKSRIGFTFLHDNASPHVAKSMQEKLLKLGWIMISHPSYSPDLAFTNYHLYRSLSDYLRETRSDDENDLKMELVKFFGEKCQDFYEGRILSLKERWRQVVDSNEAYLVES